MESKEYSALLAELAGAVMLVTLKGLVGFENNFNGIYFHRHFLLKSGVKSL